MAVYFKDLYNKSVAFAKNIYIDKIRRGLMTRGNYFPRNIPREKNNNQKIRRKVKKEKHNRNILHNKN